MNRISFNYCHVGGQLQESNIFLRGSKYVRKCKRMSFNVASSRRASAREVYHMEPSGIKQVRKCKNGLFLCQQEARCCWQLAAEVALQDVPASCFISARRCAAASLGLKCPSTREGEPARGAAKSCGAGLLTQSQWRVIK